MEFRCLWLTSLAEFNSWKIFLNAFPFPLLHKHYKSISEENLETICQQTAACFWSEKEYAKTPKSYRDFLATHQKPSLLLLKNEAFAYIAFERGITQCLPQKEANQKLTPELIKLLTHYFKPQNKPNVFLHKLYVPVNPEENEIHFVEFDSLIRIYSQNGIQHVECTNRILKTTIPLEWLAVQCQISGLQFCILNKRTLLNTNFIKNIEIQKHYHICTLLNGVKIDLNSEEYLKLQLLVKVN